MELPTSFSKVVAVNGYSAHDYPSGPEEHLQLLYAIALRTSPMCGVTAISHRRLSAASGSEVKSAKEIEKI
jgi:hypothetical protein